MNKARVKLWVKTEIVFLKGTFTTDEFNFNCTSFPSIEYKSNLIFQ